MDIKIPFLDNGRDVTIIDDEVNKILYIAKATEYNDDLRVFVARVNARFKAYNIEAVAKLENGKVVVYYKDQKVIL